MNINSFHLYNANGCLLSVAGNVKAGNDLLESRVAVAVTSYNYQVAVLNQTAHIASGALISTTYALSSALGLNG